jgi:hypothetical protein
MKLVDVVLYGAAGVLIVLATILTLRKPSTEHRPTTPLPPAGSRLEQHLTPEETTELGAVWRIRKAVAPSQAEATTERVFGQLQLPELLGGVRWREMPLADVAALLAQGPMEGLERQLMMRGLVARLRESADQIDAATRLVREGVPGSAVLVIALGRTGAEKSAEALSVLASCADVASRELAVLSLAQDGREPYLNAPPESVRKLPGITAEPAWAIKGTAGSKLVSLLTKDNHPTVLATLIAVLAEFQSEPRTHMPPDHGVDSELVSKRILELARWAEEPELRKAAVQALQRTQSAPALGALRDALLSDRESAVRKEAAAGLTGLATEELAFNALARAVVSDSDANVRASAASALAPSGCGSRREAAFNLCVAQYRLEREATVRYYFLRNASQCGDAARSLLQEATENDPDPSLRSYARQLLDGLQK